MSMSCIPGLLEEWGWLGISGDGAEVIFHYRRKGLLPSQRFSREDSETSADVGKRMVG